MKRITLAKHGFEPDGNYTLHGSRYTVYKVGTRLRLSKAIISGTLAINVYPWESDLLPYAEYKELPHYTNMFRINGKPCDMVTEEDLARLYNDCLVFEKEFIEAESKVVLPTYEELANKCYEIQAKIKEEIKIVENMDLSQVPESDRDMFEWHCEKLKESYDNYSPENYLNEDYIKSYSCFNLLNRKIKDSFWYTEILEFLDNLK